LRGKSLVIIDLGAVGMESPTTTIWTVRGS
jgi:hypothetical protein